MNYKRVLHTLGIVLCFEALSMLLPLLCALIYKEQTVVPFLESIFLCLAFGLCLIMIKGKSKEIYAKEDERFVPASEEHEKLFNYLDKKLEKQDFLFKTKIKHTYNECLKACIYTLKNEIIIATLSFLAFVIGIFGIFKNMMIFYYSLTFIFLLTCFIVVTAKKKTKQIFELIKYAETEEELYFYETYFMSSNHLNSHIKYKHLYRVSETKNNFYLYLNSSTYFNIKKDDLSQKAQEVLRKLK